MVQAQAVHLFADGRFYGPPHLYVYPSAKLWPLPHLSAAIAVRGPMRLPPFLASVLGSLAQTYDELKAVAVDAIRSYMPEITEIVAAGHPEPDVFDLVVGGISESTGLDSFLISSHNGFAKPWVVYDLTTLPKLAPGLAMLPSIREMYPDIEAVLAGRSAADLDPVVDGIRLVEVQRAKWPGPPESSPDEFLQLMTITNDAISTRVIQRWPLSSDYHRS
jgi:hypothetical protein